MNTINHPNHKDQREAVQWAKDIITNPSKYLILDTETTGIGELDEVIELAIIDPRGKILHNQRYFSGIKISKKAQATHGITFDDISNKPLLANKIKTIKKIFSNKTIIAYNSDFDARLLSQSILGVKKRDVPTNNKWFCAMKAYAQLIGEINPRTGGYKWHKLKGGDHTALGDCNATLNLIKVMASTKKIKRKWEFWKN